MANNRRYNNRLIGNTTGTTSIQFGTGSALSTFVDWTNFTPTIVGESTAGVTTYTNQQGQYCRIGNIVTCTIDVRCSAATGTGNINIAGLPFTINSSGTVTTGPISMNGVVLPVSTSAVALYANANTTFSRINAYGVTGANGFVQMANAAQSFFCTLTYRI